METLDHRVAATLLMKAATEVLQIPAKVAATALLYLHQFQRTAVHNRSCQALVEEPFRLVCATLFVASKVNEVVLTASDLINMLLGLTRTHFWSTALDSIPGLQLIRWERYATLMDGSALSGDAYYAAKSRLVADEQVVLRALQFQVSVELPHTILFNICRALDCTPGVMRIALCLLNDSMHYTDLLATHKPESLAAAALHLALLLSGRAQVSGSSLSTHRWTVGLSAGAQELEEICHVMLDALKLDTSAA